MDAATAATPAVAGSRTATSYPIADVAACSIPVMCADPECPPAGQLHTHSFSLLMRPLRLVMSDLIFSLRASQEGTKPVPMDPEAISMSVESPPNAAPSSLAVALLQR